MYSASAFLPAALTDAERGPSYDVTRTALQEGLGTESPMWEWLEEKVKVKDLVEGRYGSHGAPSPYKGPFGAELRRALEGRGPDDIIARPELEIFGPAMAAVGKSMSTAHLYGERVGDSAFSPGRGP